MRAIFLDQSFNLNQQITLSEEKSHHFFNVLRLKDKESILVLNGKGQTAMAELNLISKKAAMLKINHVETQLNTTPNIDLGIGKLKKDSMEEAIRICIELGIRNLVPISSQFSNSNELELGSPRLEKIIENSMEQSNNFFRMDIQKSQNITSINPLDYHSIFLFSNKISPRINIQHPNIVDKVLILIGPEGGFSDSEEDEIIKNCQNISTIKINAPILRATTAIAAAVGHVHSLYQKKY